MCSLMDDRGSEADGLVSLQPNLSSALMPALLDPGFENTNYINITLHELKPFIIT